MRRHQQLPSCTSDHFPAEAATFLHRWPLTCSSNYHSSTSNHFPAEAATSPALATTFLHQWSPSCTSRYQQLPVLHQRLPVLNQQLPSCTSYRLPAPADTSSYQFFTSNYQFWTSNHFPAPADTSPKAATAFLHQRSPSSTSDYQSWTSDHFLAPADTSNYQSWTIYHLPAPTDTSPKTSNHLSALVETRPAPATRSYSNEHHPSAAIVHRALFRFLIRHNKVWPFESTPLFCHSCLVVNHSYISKVCGDWYIYLASATFWTNFLVDTIEARKSIKLFNCSLCCCWSLYFNWWYNKILKFS